MMTDKPGKKPKKISSRLERASKLVLDIPQDDESMEKAATGSFDQ
jgi:hypothetical protein